ncbi:MAG: aldehyde ferredoxin oxidoreductase family protein [Anaerolineales bacterium]|jgi:aldehyde:ferredoxin oxidoreductase
MPHGYHSKILHVDLTIGKVEVEEPDPNFYRKYIGGGAMGAYYLFKMTPPGSDPLGPENTLCLMVGPVTGAPISGQSRVNATAVSPRSGLVGDSSGGGFWPSEFKATGFDGIVIRGRAEKPVYLWLNDGEVELRDASHLWGHFTAEVEDLIREELDDNRIEVLQCGPAAEKGVKFGALISNANRANGRSGLGSVMASKNLKAVAVRGQKRPKFANPDAIKELSRWGAEHFKETGLIGLRKDGTASGTVHQSNVGGLPTRNWQSGTFEGAEAITGKTMTDTILKDIDTCFGCVIGCKREVEVPDGPYRTIPRYGGPEYETVATLGSYCGVSDLSAIAYANQLCNMHGMDTISCGATIAWAMDCFEQGLITLEDTNGIELRFGNTEAMVETVERIGRREGFGHVLGEGSTEAAKILGVGGDLVVATKGRELPAHVPQVKQGLGLIYAVNPFGADHTAYEHDPVYEHFSEELAQIDLLDPQPAKVLNSEKVRFTLYTQHLVSAVDSVCVCWFAFGPGKLYTPNQLVDIVQATTGWKYSLWDLMKVGERRLHLLRAFNAREGVGAESDTLPPKMFKPLRGGESDGLAINPEEIEKAKKLYYQMVGWDENGKPTRAKLEELALGWVADQLDL